MALSLKQANMEVEFHRTDEEHYRIAIHRTGLPPIEMDPAPGFDAIMPHDLLHLVVEAELGLSRGVFGQVAAGGTAGTFHRRVAPGENRREVSRERRRAAARGDKLLREGRQEAAQSERATYLCLHEWLSRSKDTERKRRAHQMAAEATHIWGRLPRDEVRALSDEVLDRVCARLDELSRRWARLPVGMSIRVQWARNS